MLYNIMGWSLIATIILPVFMPDWVLAHIGRGLECLAQIFVGTLKWLAIGLGIVIFCAVCAGFAHAIGLVPFLLLCLLWQGGERRA